MYLLKGLGFRAYGFRNRFKAQVYIIRLIGAIGIRSSITVEYSSSGSKS